MSGWFGRARGSEGSFAGDLTIAAATQAVALFLSYLVMAKRGNEDWGWGFFLVLIECSAGAVAGFTARGRRTSRDDGSLFKPLAAAAVAYSTGLFIIFVIYFGGPYLEVSETLLFVAGLNIASGLISSRLPRRPAHGPTPQEGASPRPDRAAR